MEKICKTEHKYFAYIKGKSSTNYITRSYIVSGCDMDFWCIEANGYKNRSSALTLAKNEKERGEHGQDEIGIVDITLDYIKNDFGNIRPYRFIAKHLPC